MEPGTPEAVAVLTLALEHSGRLGHRYIGGEHLLLALVSSGQSAGAVLREHGVTPQRVEEEIVRHAGHGPGAGLFGGLDRDALAATGLWRREDGTAVFIPFTRSAREFWDDVRDEARAQHAPGPGSEHVALAVIAMNDGLVPRILSALGVSAPALRAAILDRCRQAN